MGMRRRMKKRITKLKGRKGGKEECGGEREGGNLEGAAGGAESLFPPAPAIRI